MVALGQKTHVTRGKRILFQASIVLLPFAPAWSATQSKQPSAHPAGQRQTARSDCANSPTMRPVDRASPCPSDAGADAGWTIWHNDRFGFTICYPQSLFPIARESPEKHAIAMESADSAQMIAAGMTYTRKTLAEPIRMEKERLTHIALMSSSRDLTNGDTEFVVSGTRVDQILYTKAIRSGDRLIAIRFRYPQSLKARYAPIVERIAGCLRFSKKEG